ncbi:TPA: hypothetical protein I3946_000667 [Enterobacter cloacae]|nr:hypothetical protein [Enterobacter cloacae]HBC2544404.1 hypothetical protein [Enterobacter cloacae]
MKPFDPYSIVIAVNQLADVVNEASQTNLFKDYFMPVFVVILSSITAYIIAIRGYQFQEAAKNERMKADTLNSILGHFMNFDEEETRRMYIENSVVITTPKE